MKELRPYQLEAIKDIVEKRRVLIADDMGLGKCAESISAKTIIERRQGYDRPTLVVSPAAVAEHWVDEIKEWYQKKKNSRVTTVQAHTYAEDLQRARNADFVVISYPTLSYFGTHNGRLQPLQDIGFQYGIIDEAHNAKNPSSIRTRAVKDLFDSMEYLAILSGTPIPNTVVDIYTLLSLLDKDAFPLNQESPSAILSGFYTLFRKDPEFVRGVLNDRMLRRTVDDYLHESVPELREKHVPVELEGDHKDVYLQLYENDELRASSKLIQLVKASVDPNLVDPKLLPGDLRSRHGAFESSVYNALDDLVGEVVARNGKVLAFTDLKKGVTYKLRDRYTRHGALVIDGDVSSTRLNGNASEREETRVRFQNDPNSKILIVTGVMDEGVDLTAATDVVHITRPYTPAAIDQRNRRSQRIGEVKKDFTNVHYLTPRLSGLMPTIAQGIQGLLDDKRRIITYIMEKPFAVTKEDLEEIKNGKSQRSRHLVPLISSPASSVVSHFGQTKGQGFSNILEHYEKYPEEAEFIARLYAEHWDGYYGGNTANLYARVISVLQETEDLTRKVDIASGPFSLSRRIKEPVANLDLNPHMLNAGKLLEEQGRIVPGNVGINGAFHQLPFANDSFDLSVCSLALHMSRTNLKYQGKTINEREQALREMNRVLRTGGYSLVTLPHTVIREQDFARFNTGLQQLGFEVLPFSGFYKGPSDSKFRVYLAGLRKVSDPIEKPVDESLVRWKMDEGLGKRKTRSKSDRRKIIPEKKETKSEIITEFYPTRGGRSLEESIRSSL